jgi:predicted MPP superfamily phosphohydrolase
VALNRKQQMAIFLTVVLTVYILTNLYLYLKGRRALAGAGYQTTWFTVVFVVLASTFVAGKFLENTFTNIFADILNVIGGFWMAFMLYGFLIWLTADILLLLQKPFHLIPAETLPRLRLWLFAGVTTATLALIIIGFIIAISPITSRYDLAIDKHFTDGSDSMKIVAVSDIHLGSIIRKRSMRHLSRMISQEEPDIVLFLGDLLDGTIGPVLRDDLLSYLILPELKYGKFAITGNHEFMSDLKKSIPYIESKGIRMLSDEVVRLDNGMQIAGRTDRTAMQGRANGRASLDSLLSGIDASAPLILLDHQPYGLAALAGTAVDLQLSGHTHNGQMWPLTLITDRMFELSHGYKMFGKTHVIVSSGFGIWGPLMRIGTRPEILSITLRGRSE